MFAAEQVGIAHLEGAPDASKIAWVTWNPSTSEVQIQIFARATAKVRTIAEWHQPVLTGYGQPLISLAWSPDASIIYCAQSLTENEQSISQLWAIPTDGREKQLLTQVVGEVPFGLSMNQDARRLLFSAGTQAEFQLQLLQIHHF